MYLSNCLLNVCVSAQPSVQLSSLVNEVSVTAETQPVEVFLNAQPEWYIYTSYIQASGDTLEEGGGRMVRGGTL